MTILIPNDGLMMSARRGGNKQAMHAGGRSQQGPPNVDNILRGSAASDYVFGPICLYPPLADSVEKVSL